MFFTGRANRVKITFYQLETKKEPFFYIQLIGKCQISNLGYMTVVPNLF